MPKNTAIDSLSPEISKEFISAIADLCEEWDKTEKWIKDGEQIRGKPIIPSINEMRYAGRQIVDACRATQSHNDAKATDHIQDARRNLLRARHDVVDATFNYIVKNAHNIQQEVGAGNLKTHFGAYENFFGLLKTVANKISNSRQGRECRDEIYHEIINNHLPELCKWHDELEASQPAIEQNIQQYQKEIRASHRFAIIGVIIGITGSIVGVMGFFW